MQQPIFDGLVVVSAVAREFVFVFYLHRERRGLLVRLSQLLRKRTPFPNNLVPGIHLVHFGLHLQPQFDKPPSLFRCMSNLVLQVLSLVIAAKLVFCQRPPPQIVHRKQGLCHSRSYFEVLAILCSKWSVSWSRRSWRSDVALPPCLSRPARNGTRVGREATITRH